MKTTKRSSFLIASLVAGALVFSLVYQQTAWAAGPYFNRKKGERYFTGQTTDQNNGRYMFEDGLPRNYQTTPTTVDIFISEVKFYLYNDNHPEFHTARAAIVVNTMMGINGDDSRYNGPSNDRWRNGVQVARNLLPQWESIVRGYDAGTIPGASVEWNAVKFFPDRTRDGYGDGTTPQGTKGFSPDMFIGEVPEEIEDTIVFNHPNGRQYNINKKCGNLIGDISPLFIPPTTNPPGSPPPSTPPPTGAPGFNYVPSIVNDIGNPQSLPGNGASTSPASGVVPNQLLRFDLRTTNNGNSKGPIGRLQGKFFALDPNTGQFFNYNDPGCSGSCYNSPERSTPPQKGMVYATGEGILYNPTNQPNTPEILPGRTFVGTPNSSESAPRSMSFRIPADAPVGRKYCFYAHIEPGNQKGGSPFTNLGALCFIVTNGSTLPPPVTPPPTGAATANRPYFRVRGGDVSAGQGMNVNGRCTDPNMLAGVVSWNRGSPGGYGGAGAQYAAFVLNHLQEFATAQGSAAAPSGLAFANTVGTTDQMRKLYGGQFANGSCVTDYFAGATPATTQNGDRRLSQLLGAQDSGSVTTPVVLPNAPAPGSQLTYYIKGDLYIDRNIHFSGTYANITEIPSFSVVVQGNLLIDQAVTRIDGVYVAQPLVQQPGNTQTKGVIYTCATDSTLFSPLGLDNRLHDVCNTALTVNGSLVARQVWLMRTFGDLASEPAETINYIPEMWLSVRSGSGGSLRSSGYDSITSLPPVL